MKRVKPTAFHSTSSQTHEHNQAVINSVLNINSPFFSVIWNSSAMEMQAIELEKRKDKSLLVVLVMLHTHNIMGNY
jgi:hypothetical protein